MKRKTALLCGMSLVISVLAAGCGSGQSDQTSVATVPPAATDMAEASFAPAVTEPGQDDTDGALDDADETTAGVASAKPDEADEGGLTDGDNSSDQTGASSDTSSSKKISKEKAAQIALERVKGAKESDVSIHSEWDDGREIYEGSIIYQGREYDFEIDATNGNILEWEEEELDED